MGTSNTEANKVREAAAFDVLRFALASAVMLSHIGVLRWQWSGDLAVQVFFALSGWLIGGILCDTLPAELSRFYFNRATRIWIPYCACVGALYLVSYFHESVRTPRWSEFLAYDLTFTHNWFTLRPNAQLALREMPLHGTGNHFWSLAVEEQFYLLAPLVITLLPFGKSVLLWVALAAGAYLSGSQYGAISLGVLSAVIAHKRPDWYLRPVTMGALIIIATGAALGLAVAYLYSAPVFAVCIVLLSARPWKRSPITRWLGGISFPFYLNAWIGTFVFHALVKHLGLQDAWYLTLTEFLFGLATAAIAYGLIDAQILKRRSRFYRPQLGWALEATGYLLVLAGVIVFLRLSGRAP